MLLRRSVRSVRPLLASASGAGPSHGMDGQPRGVPSQPSVCTAVASRDDGQPASIPAPRASVASREPRVASSSVLRHHSRQQQGRRPPRRRGRADQPAAAPLPEGTRRQVPARPPCATGEAGGGARTAGTATTILPIVGVNRGTGPTIVAPSRLAGMDLPRVAGPQAHVRGNLLGVGRAAAGRVSHGAFLASLAGLDLVGLRQAAWACLRGDQPGRRRCGAGAQPGGNQRDPRRVRQGEPVQVAVHATTR